MKNGEDLGIIKNLRTIEWLKSEVLKNVADLFQFLVIGDEKSKNEILDYISNIILFSYLLGRKLGINYEKIDNDIYKKLRLTLAGEYKVEEWYEDLSKLMIHLDTKE